MSKTTTLVVTLLGVLVLAVNAWFWVAIIPEQAMKLHQMYAERHPPIEMYDCPPYDGPYDCYEYEGDYPDCTRDYGEGTAEDTDMPGPLLECEAGDHTCID